MYWFIEGMSFIKKSLFFVLVLLCPASLFSQQNKDSAKLIVKEKSQINALAVNADSSLMLEATGNSVVLWNAVTLQKMHTFTGFSSPVIQIKFNKNSDSFLTVAQDNTVSVFSLSDYKEVISLTSYVNSRNIGASFSGDGRSILAATDGINVDSYFILLYTMDFILQKECSHKDVYSIDVNKNNLMLTAGMDRQIQIFDLKNNLSLYSIPAYTAEYFPAVFSADGKSFVCADSQNVLTLRNLSGNVLLKIQDDDLFTQTVSFSSDGKYLAALLKNGSVRIYDLMTGFVSADLDFSDSSGNTEDSHDAICDIQFVNGSKSIFVCTKNGFLYRFSINVNTQVKPDKQKDTVTEEQPQSAVPLEKDVPKNTQDAYEENLEPLEKDEVLQKDNQNSEKNIASETKPVSPKDVSGSKKSAVKKGNTFSENMNGNLPSSTFFVGAGYTIIPSQFYIGDFDLDLCFQKYFSELHASVGIDLNGGFALPVKDFPYKYMLLDGNYEEAPWLYTIRPSLTAGIQSISKNGNRIFFDVLAGSSIRFVWNNSVKACIITKPVYSYSIGVSAGVDFHGLTLKASLFYNTQVEFQPSAQVGYSVKYFKKEGK